MLASLARSIHQTNGFPPYARSLSKQWREDITAVARRQPTWTAGFRDWQLLERHTTWPQPSNQWLLTYGDPALLLVPDVLGLARDLRDYERSVVDQLGQAKSPEARTRLVDELKLTTLLLAGFNQLKQLNATTSVDRRVRRFGR